MIPPAHCSACQLGHGASQTVAGDGPVPCDIMIIGEAPGYYEDRSGLPFVGDAGKMLTRMLDRVGITPRQCYITNIVKCRPPRNRDPEPDEVDTCTRLYLAAELLRVNPKVIIACGKFAASYFVPDIKVSKAHGIPRKQGRRVILPVYHPAAALHQRKLLAALETDFMAVPDALALAEQEDLDIVVRDGIAPRAALVALDTEYTRDGKVVCFSTATEGGVGYVYRVGTQD